MQLFYGTEINGNSITLSQQESSHCIRVLRMKPGDEVHVTDGNGHFFTGNIELAHDKKTTVTIFETTQQPRLNYDLHLYVAITKHSDRLEWMLEKCTEMGLSSFTPLITQRTERKNIRIDRLESTVLSAMKQSLKAWLPKVNPPRKLLESFSIPAPDSKWIAHCNEGEKKLLSEVRMDGATHIFIGPEGDFSPDEIDLAVQHGLTPISLGPSRLRTETAGLVACAGLYMAHIKA